MPTLTIPELRKRAPVRPPIVEVHLDEAVERAKEMVAAGMEAGAAAAATLPSPAEVVRAIPTDAARDSARELGGSVRQAVRDRLKDAATSLDSSPVGAAVNDRLPRRRGPSKLPFVAVGLLVGLAVVAWLLTSSMFAPKIRATLDRARGRVGSGETAEEDLEVLVERYDSPDQPLGSRPDAGLGDYQLETSNPEASPFPEA